MFSVALDPSIIHVPLHWHDWPSILQIRGQNISVGNQHYRRYVLSTNVIKSKGIVRKPTGIIRVKERDGQLSCSLWFSWKAFSCVCVLQMLPWCVLFPLSTRVSFPLSTNERFAEFGRIPLKEVA